MADRLTVILSGRTLERRELADAEGKITIGRSPENDITIDNVAVSRQHCELSNKGGIWQLRDTGSDNGTYVNGKQIQQPFNLNSGDMIEVGKYTLRFDQSFAVEDDEEKGNKPSRGKMTARVGYRPVHVVRAYFAMDEGSETSLIEKPLFLIGKRPDCDLKITGWSAPGVAAVVASGSSGFRIVDVSEKADSIKINGVATRDHWLNEEDHVVIRGLAMRFHRGRPVG